MSVFWVALCSVLPALALFSGPEHCAVQDSSSLRDGSPLKALQCYNDFRSYVQCKWTEHGNTKLQLWFQTQDGNREQCLPYGSAQQEGNQSRVVQCRFETRAFSSGIRHTVFFLEAKTQSLCSSVSHKPLQLSQHLKVRSPVDLTAHDAGDGGQWIHWSSPYPSGSALNRNITYQLSYRTDSQDSWTTEDVTNTSLKLGRHLLLPGRRYEAKVRARASVGQWSFWTPVVTWQTEADVGQLPTLHCVLHGETEVACSWEVPTELADLVEHKLVCRRNQTALPERCCRNLTVLPDLSGTRQRYSCLLTATDPARLLLELKPTVKTRTLRASQHIRPDPPQQVKVREKDGNWIVEWTAPRTPSYPGLVYQLCYHKTKTPDCSVQNVSQGAMFHTILAASLDPSQDYQARVRSLVRSEGDSVFGGIPSKWTDPVDWTSHEATWSLTTLIYLCIAIFVVVVFITLYCTIPACQRKVILWVDSVPSPGKSKILFDIQTTTNQTLIEKEKTSMCKVQLMDSMSTCSSDLSLWPSKDSESSVEQDESCCKRDNQLQQQHQQQRQRLAEIVTSSDTSSLSFSGPYIFCQTLEPSCRSAEVKSQEKEEETSSDTSETAPPITITLFGEGYVSLPSRTMSRSSEDLVSHSNTHSTEQDQLHPDASAWPDKTEVEPDLSGFPPSHQHPAYTTGPSSVWPQEGNLQASGYCHLPTAHTTARLS
ncbi:uncharacterized protein V6R79_016059 [Siganus canaliculatus]